MVLFVSAQSDPPAKKQPDVAFKTLKDYNKYVASIDFRKLSRDRKVWLENEYNRLIEELDVRHHGISRPQITQRQPKNQVNAALSAVPKTANVTTTVGKDQ